MANDLPFVERCNRLIARAWAKGWWPRPTLDRQALEAEACLREKASAVPGDEWRQRFALLLRDLEETAELNPLGRTIANGQMVGLLRARIRSGRLLAAHAEIAARPLHRPVIILGHMRSGTTRLHRLLAQDPRFARTRLFESLEPVPRRGRLPRAAAVLAFLHCCNPALAAIHPARPRQAEEEYGFHSFSFHGAQFEAQWHVPGFTRHAEGRDAGSAYAEFADLMRLNGWARREDPGRTWLLKSPQFLSDPDALLSQFPDARLLCLHRDHASVVASSASLVWNQRRVHSDRTNKAEIGREWLGKTALRERRAAAARAANPQVPQFDVSYDAISADWQAVVREIYAFLGLDLPASVLARMQRFMTRPARHAGHRYTLEEFGLGDAEVQASLNLASTTVVEGAISPDHAQEA